jgi:enterochelin esterase-like enzyme
VPAADLWERAVTAGAPLVSAVDARGLVEVTFVWRGEAERASVAGSIRLPLRRQPGTDVWHGTVRLPARLRTVYWLSHVPPEQARIPPDDTGSGPAHIDLLNPGRLRFPGDPGDPTDRDCWVSVLTLPHADPETWSVPDPDVPAGELTEAVVGGRRVSVHRPAGTDRAGAPALIVFDGYLARTVLANPVTVDNLVAAGRIPPLVTLFVHGTDATRDADLAPSSPVTTRFVLRELMPWARRAYGLSPYPRDVGVAGVSLGGLAAAHLALRAPEAVGAVIAQSGSFWWPGPGAGEPEWLTREYAARPRADLRFYLDAGDRETQPAADGTPSLLAATRRFRDALRAKGYPVTYAEYPGGHDYVNWRRTFADALIAIFGT